MDFLNCTPRRPSIHIWIPQLVVSINLSTQPVYKMRAIAITRSSSLSFKRLMSSKVFASAAEAVKDIKDSSKLLCGGFGICGIPETLIEAVKDNGAKGIYDFVISLRCCV